MGYLNWLKALHKIPASYIDFQHRYHIKADQEGVTLCTNPLVNDKKYIYSYHGNSINMIHDFLNYYNCNKHKNDIIKLYYNGPEHIWTKNHELWKNHTSICVNMRNPITRLDNKFKLIRRMADDSRLIDIPTRPELMMLKQLRRLFRWYAIVMLVIYNINKYYHYTLLCTHFTISLIILIHLWDIN